MVEKINIINEDFEYVKKYEGKLIYKSLDNKFNQIKILELSLSSDQKIINKLDLYTFENDEIYESIHVIRGIDGITEIDYYPTNYECLNINGKKEHYTISIYSTYKEENNEFNKEVLELDITKKGHKKHKILYKVPTSTNLYVSKQNKYFNVNTHSINKFNHYTESILDFIKKSKDLSFNELKDKPKEIKKQLLIPQIIIPGKSIESLLDEDLFTEKELNLKIALEKYPSKLYVYDRNYELIGSTKETVVYRNTEDNIIDLEIYHDNNKIKEIRFIYYKENEVKKLSKKNKKKDNKNRKNS